ncbi:MAG TPA: PadR family transcriptional regulator [Thermoflexia bacterium]|nr:PadR family transcriptional regulator [Thermoflexia bacterium]
MPGRGRRRHGGGPQPHWGRRKRILQPLILLLLAEKATHGYGLTERLTDNYALGAIVPQTIYRALREMEEAGWIAPSWDLESGQGPPRKVYQVTPVGISALEIWSQEMQGLRGMVNVFLESYQQLHQGR